MMSNLLIYSENAGSNGMAANEKVFAMAGYSMNVQPEQILY